VAKAAQRPINVNIHGLDKDCMTLTRSNKNHPKVVLLRVLLIKGVVI